MLSLDEPRRLLGLARHPHLGDDAQIAPVVRDAKSRFDASQFLVDGSGANRLILTASSPLPPGCPELVHRLRVVRARLGSFRLVAFPFQAA